MKTMKNLKTAVLAAALALGMFISCGDPIPDETPLSVDKVLIAGDGSKYLKVAAGEYTLKKIEKDRLSITVKLEATQTLDRAEFLAAREDAEPGGKIGFDGIRLLLTDSVGAALDSYLSLSTDSQGKAKLQDLLTGNYSEAAVTFSALVAEKKTIRKLMGASGFELAQADITYDKKAAASGGVFGEIKDALGGVKDALFGSEDQPSAQSKDGEVWDQPAPPYEPEEGEVWDQPAPPYVPED
jgi:hypothetical protein